MIYELDVEREGAQMHFPEPAGHIPANCQGLTLRLVSVWQIALVACRHHRDMLCSHFSSSAGERECGSGRAAGQTNNWSSCTYSRLT